MARLKEHDNYCRGIAETLESIIRENTIKCGECDELFVYDGDEDIAECPHCGAENEYPHYMSVYGFVDDALEIDVLCSLRGEYKGAKLCLTVGGPNVYVNTWTREVNLYWWCDSGSWQISEEAADAIDEAVSELFELYRK